jgi:hypothetical protein
MPQDLRRNLAERGLPIVDGDRECLVENLRSLVCDPLRRRALGEAGRRFVIEHHSYEAVGAIWDQLIRHVWLGAPLPDELPTPTGGRP